MNIQEWGWDSLRLELKDGRSLGFLTLNHYHYWDSAILHVSFCPAANWKILFLFFSFFFTFQYKIQLAQLIFFISDLQSHIPDQFWLWSSSTNGLDNSGWRSAYWGLKDLHVFKLGVGCCCLQGVHIIISLPHTGSEQKEKYKNKADGKLNTSVFADKMKLGSLDEEPSRPTYWTPKLGRPKYHL